MTDELREWVTTVRTNMAGRPPGARVPAGPAPEPVAFTDEQRDEFRDALHETRLALMRAIGREAARPDSYDGPRNVGRLVMALEGLRRIAQDQPGFGGGWFGHPMFVPDIDDVDEGDEG